MPGDQNIKQKQYCKKKKNNGPQKKIFFNPKTMKNILWPDNVISVAIK